MARLRRPEFIVYILIVALGAGLLYWQRERIQNLVTDEPEAPAKPGASPKGVDAGGGDNNSPSGQPGPPSGGPPAQTPAPANPGGPPDSSRPTVDVDVPAPVSVCLGPLASINCP